MRRSCPAVWLLALMMAGPAAAADPAEASCRALTERVDAVAGNGPLFLRSYDDEAGAGAPAEPALANAAFTYDNALAVIALVACGRPVQALRIGEALLAAARDDRSGVRGRLRNTYRAGAQFDYRAGAQSDRPVPPMGWWDAAAGHWAEDPYQVGTATGNVAWAGLALLTLYEATGDARFRDGAGWLAGWVVGHADDPRGGFAGGIWGYDDAPRPVGWKSTEHNVDLAALFARLGAEWAEPHRRARDFVAAMWDDAAGRFVVGTLPDGVTINRRLSGLDAQLWPLLLPGAAPRWRRALDYAERAHGVDGGFDFNDDRDGLWVEGTAQAALVYRTIGAADKAGRLLADLAREISPGGYVWATRAPSITTGLAIHPDSTSDDFRYYRRPHLGATAWVALAALGWNPFTGQVVKK